jgi:hypothetical protein
MPYDPLVQQVAAQKSRQQPLELDPIEEAKMRLLETMNTSTPTVQQTPEQRQQQGLALAMLIGGKGRGLGDVGRMTMGNLESQREQAQRQAELEQARKSKLAQFGYETAVGEKQNKEEEARWQKDYNLRAAEANRRADSESWAVIADPVSGGFIRYNKKTGEYAPIGPGGGAKGEGTLPQFNPALGMKPTEKMKNDLLAIQQQRAAITGATGTAKMNPQAFGVSATNLAEQFGGAVGAAIAGWKRNPQDTAARSFVLNNVSKIINERAGAAQSAQELARLRGFLPNEIDDVARVEAKFNSFLDYLDEIEAATRGYTMEELGYTRRVGAGPTKEAAGESPVGGQQLQTAPSGPAPLRDPASYIPGGG